MTYQRVEVLTGAERRRIYTPAEKARMVEEAFRPGVVVTQAARRFGVHESLLYRWRRMMMMTGSAMADMPDFAAVTITPEPRRPEPAPLSEPSPPVPAAGIRAAVEITLPCGARVRLDGTVDPALAAAIVGALVTPRRAP